MPLLSGARTVENPHGIFGLNVGEAEFEAVSRKNLLPIHASQFFFTPTLINTGTEYVLFDTGVTPEGMIAALAAAGLTPQDIDTIVITHMHGDHINGLMNGGDEVFTNACYVTGQVEYDFWAKAENEGFEEKVRPLAEKFSFIKGGQSVAPGIDAIDAFGHTPGHMNFMLDSDGAQMCLIVDSANHYVWSLAYPDWEVKFDMDKTRAAANRRRIFDMLAADRVPFTGYHMPFPAVGYVETRGDGYRYVPHSYQLYL